MPDLVGFPSTVDASDSTDPAGRALSYQWHFSSVPAGSTVTDASFSSATGLTSSFAPDLGGVYQVTLIVSTSDGGINQLTKPMLIPTAPVFYAGGDSDAKTTSFTASIIRSDGSGGRTVSCSNSFDLGNGPSSTGNFDPAAELFISGLASFRAFDGAAPQMVFARLGQSASGNGSWTQQLLVANDQNDCATRPPLRVDMAAQLGAADWSFFMPRFSPDGKRIVVLALGNTGSSSMEKLVTVGSDGSGFRVVRNFAASSDRIIAPGWVDSATVAWAEQTSGSGSLVETKIMKAADAVNAGDGAGAATVIDCAPSTPFATINQFEFVDATTVIFAAATIAATNNAPGLVNLYRESVGSCTTANALTKETVNGHFSGDFAVSPDKKTVLFASTSGSPPPAMQAAILTDIFVVPVDGGSAPKRIAGDPKLIDASPRFIANGRQIVWTQFGQVPQDAGNGAGVPTSSALMMANADGSNARTLVAANNKSGEAHYALTGSNAGNGCAVAGGAASAGALVALGLTLLLGFARRRAG